MIIQVLSDIHLEHRPRVLPKIDPKANVLVFAGDVGSDEYLVSNYFKDLRKETKATIIYVLGNHEFYGKFLHNVSEYREMLKDIPDVHLLNNETFVKDGVRFLGCTLWTDFDGGRAELDAQYGMLDYREIRTVDKNYQVSRINTKDILKEHIKSRDFLHRELENASSNYPEQKVVVVTHHGPSFYCVTEKWRGSRLNGAFYVELSDLIMNQKPTLWIYGHNHDSNELVIGSTQLVSEPWGYPFEGRESLDPKLIEVV